MNETNKNRWIVPLGAERRRWIEKNWKPLKAKNGSDLINLLVDIAREKDAATLSREVEDAAEKARQRQMATRRQELLREADRLKEMADQYEQNG